MCRSTYLQSSIKNKSLSQCSGVGGPNLCSRRRRQRNRVNRHSCEDDDRSTEDWILTVSWLRLRGMLEANTPSPAWKMCIASRRMPRVNTEHIVSDKKYKIWTRISFIQQSAMTNITGIFKHQMIKNINQTTFQSYPYHYTRIVKHQMIKSINQSTLGLTRSACCK